MRILTLLNILLFSIILINQLYYVYKLKKLSKNIDHIHRKILEDTDIRTLEFLILKRNYEISKFYYIYFVNFTFITRLLYKLKEPYAYYELGEYFE